MVPTGLKTFSLSPGLLTGGRGAKAERSTSEQKIAGLVPVLSIQVPKCPRIRVFSNGAAVIVSAVRLR